MPELTDLDIVRACAAAIDIEIVPNAYPEPRSLYDIFNQKIYWPLTDKAQALSLVIELHMLIMPGTRTPEGRMPWNVEATDRFTGRDHDLLRAICLCAARVQLAKETT